MIWAFASSITTKILFNGSTVGSTSLKMSHSTKKIDQIDQNFFSKHFNLVKSKLEKGFLKRHLTILHEFYSEVCKWDILGDFPTLWGVRTSITVGNYCWWFWVGLNCCSFWQWDARTSTREKTLTYRQLSLDKLRNGMHVILSLYYLNLLLPTSRFQRRGEPMQLLLTHIPRVKPQQSRVT